MVRESNFVFPAQNRACVVISSALYDRRAIDAPSPSLPLLNSLTHLSVLTATSPRIREILALDGGLERLIRILKGCENGGPTLIQENLGQLKGKGSSLAPGPRRSPFRPFSEYRAASSSSIGTGSKDGRKSSPVSTASKHLLYTYTLAFQCVINIGVRGSEVIRTRLVEAGALEVIVNILERYLEDVDRRRVKAESDYRSRETRSSSKRHSLTTTPAVVRPLFVQLDITTSVITPPSRTATPVSSTDDSLVDDTASASGLDGDGETEAEADETASTTSSSRCSPSGRVRSIVDECKDGGSSSNTAIGGGRDGDGDVSMDTADDEPEEETVLPRLTSPISSPTPRVDQRPSLEPLPRSAPTPVSASTSLPPSSPNRVRYRDEDVLLSLQLLAYLSKYPHVRSVFHSPAGSLTQHSLDDEIIHDDSTSQNQHQHRHHEHHNETHNHAECRSECVVGSSSSPPSATTASTSAAPSHTKSTTSSPSSNIFSLVECYTHRPPTSDRFTPRHSNEVQYWAGVIMRNACRKDDSRGGLRQCANMQCGQWETFPREFAKCRRCRKAKYCSKACQSMAWALGHRYWCAKAAPKELGSKGAKEDEEEEEVEVGGEMNMRDDEGDGEEMEVELPAEASLAHARTIPSTATAPSTTHMTTTARRTYPHRSHLHSINARPSTASSVDDDEVLEEGESESSIDHAPTTTMPRRLSAAAPTTRRLAHRLSQTVILPRGMTRLDGVSIGVPPGMDENEVAHELIGGGVFGAVGVETFGDDG